MKYAINCSIMFTELPLLERPAAAKAAGFDAVEFWWPWQEAVPSDAEIAEFIKAIKDAGVQLVGLNFFAGNMPGGDRGLVSWVARQEEFRANVPVAIAIGKELNCPAFNALYGNRQADEDALKQDEVAVENLAFAAKAAAEIGATVLLEPVSGSPEYPLKKAADVMEVIAAVRDKHGVENVGFLCDLYHLESNGDDVKNVASTMGAKSAHVQIADAPGRGEPGTGELPLAELLKDLGESGYDGWVALEYKPTTESTADSFGNLPTLP